MADLTEEAATLLAGLVLGVKNGALTVDEAIGRAFTHGMSAGRIDGMEQARQIISGDTPPQFPNS